MSNATRSDRADSAWRRRHRTATVAVWAGAGLAALIVIAALVFQLSGGRWFIVETPSMGQTAPIGTLVLDSPTRPADLRVGDVISFHPPTAPTETYTHRIAKIAADGGITTRGDINGGPDPWVVTAKDLIGKATTILPGVGWLVRAIPYLLIGGAAVIFLSCFVRSRTRRSSFRIGGFSLVAAFTAFVLRPFTGVIVLATNVSEKGAHASIVSSGILPIRVTAVGGNQVDLADGEVGHLSIPSLADNAHYAVSSALNLSFWQWALFILICCIPLLYTLIVGLPRDREGDLT